MAALFLGVDVGTGSARAGLFDAAGTLVGTARHEIRIWHEAGDIVEQSSADIWAAVAAAVRGALAAAGADAADIAGIGFDATCSLVVVDPHFDPLAVGPSGDPQRNVIVWMDHRAAAEARLVNAGRHHVLSYVGGAISPEMETPKLLWLKKHMPETFSAAGHFLDLSDFLTFKATGSLARSVCTVTCKWTYLAHEKRWSADYFRGIGLAELADEGFARIGTEIVDPGTPLGRGLTAEAAEALGLRPGTPVGAALIDAHAGGFGTVGGRDPDGTPGDPAARVGYIMGTSTCIMVSTPDPVFVEGVWGPYYSAMVPGLWLAEGGQSAAGAALDHLVRCHPAHAEAEAAAKAAGDSVLGLLEARILAAAPTLSEAAFLAADLHVLPDYLGNRSPFADPDARAIVARLPLEADLDSLARLYLAGLCGLACGTAEAVGAIREAGVPLATLVVSGGAGRSPLVRRILADATRLDVALPATAEPVLLGAAMLGAVAAGAFPSARAAMEAMSALAGVIAPEGGRVAAFHDRKRAAFALLRQADRDLRTIMAGF
ncbi:FGGY-family carbohydrate kinase [Prosthecomicrobium pneumaticum]|uniref:D-ribulokinase n=1 Tax=Prosthecomicrobium pneumaticum TaxID=81895 RepID=A0A7W9FNP2_9HYPH|nr:FGGY-family carbohydrate kinase [Prosthecomicrobium pneumaticum]MBB5753976.1 D-ribulokinase [Prosthecomicrobium pneumaticum]